MPAPTFFRSGLSRRPEFAAAVRCRVPAGISVRDSSGMFIGVVQDYLRDEGHVFADSGAFGAVRKGIRLDVDDFIRVLSVYLLDGEKTQSC